MGMRLTLEQKKERGLAKAAATRAKKKADIRKNVVYSVLSAVMPKTKALQLAGYSPSMIQQNSKIEIVSPGTVQMVRERLNSVAGCTLADQVGWYVSLREDEDATASDRMAAAKQIDKVLGYEAPQKVDVSQRYEIAGAVAVFHRLLAGTGMRPNELAKAAEVEITEAEIVEPQEQ
jgi:hypothetical protein